MPKVILVSGSNRTGNTQWILNKLNEEIEESEYTVVGAIYNNR